MRPESRHRVGDRAPTPPEDVHGFRSAGPAGRRFSIGSYQVLVTLQPMRGPDGQPRFAVAWSPQVPTRMPAAWVGEFDRGLQNAKRLILAAVEGST